MAKSVSGAIIDQVMAAGVAAWFRHAGFARRGRCFFRWQGEVFITANVQASKVNMPDAATLAVNLGVEWPVVLQAWTGEPVPANPAIAPTFVQSRLNPEVGWGRDFWWPADQGSETAAIAREIVGSLRQHAQMFWEHYGDLDQVLRDFEAGVRVPTGTPSAVVHAALLARAARPIDARHVLENAAGRLPGPMCITVAKRLGLSEGAF